MGARVIKYMITCLGVHGITAWSECLGVHGITAWSENFMFWSENKVTYFIDNYMFSKSKITFWSRKYVYWVYVFTT